MALEDKRLTDLTEKVVVPDTAWVHIVDPTDTTQHPEGSSFKAKKSNIVGATTLAGLTDVNITTPTTGQALVYDSETGQWFNSTMNVIPDMGFVVYELESTDLTTQDADGITDYINALNPSILVPTNVAATFKVTDTGQVFTLQVNGASYGAGNIPITSADVVDFGINSGGTVDEATIAAINHAATTKTTLVDGDELTGQNSESAFALMVVNMLNLWNYIKTKADGYYQEILDAANFGDFIDGLTGKTTPVDADYDIIMDSADSNKAKKLSWANRKATLKTYFDTIYQVIGGGGITAVKTISATATECYGDSITVGQGSTAGNSYVELFAALYTQTVTNRAVSGRGIYEALRLAYLNINPNHNKITTLMAGFNDVRRGGSAVKTLAKLTNGYRGFICNHFLDRYYTSSHASIVTSGTWTTYAADTVGGKTAGTFSAGSGNYKEYTFKDNNVVVSMISGDGVSEIHGTFDVTIDGVSQGSYTLNGQTDGISDGANSNTRAPFVLYFDGLTEGTHTIRITHTNTATLPIDFFGNLKQPKFSNPVILLEAPKMDATGYATAPANASDAVINTLNTNLNNVVAEFDSAYPIFVAKTNDYYNVATGIDTDHIHPNNVGYRQIYAAVYNCLSTVVLDKTSAVNLLTSTNTFLGANTFSAVVKSGAGVQVQGPLTSPTGAGIEIEYATGTNIGYITAYDRAGGVWRDLITRGLTLAYHISGAEKGRWMADGLLIGTTTGDGVNKLQVSGAVKSTQYKLSALNTAPATSTSTGVLGEIRVDANYIYVCTATNVWVRTALSTF